jgi:hypothetical protein
VSRVVAVIIALLAAVHVSVMGIPAPVPAFLVAGGVIAVLCLAIFEAAHRGAPHWRAWT